MFWTNFFLELFHFSLNLFSALVFFAVSWLYFDAWSIRKNKKEGLRFIGFLCLALAALCITPKLESIQISSSLISHAFSFVAIPLQYIGFIFVIISLVIDPIPKKPKGASPFGSETSAVKTTAILPFFMTNTLPILLYPLLPLFTAILYLRRAISGLENHLKPVGVSFLLLSLSSLITWHTLFRNTKNIDIYGLVSAFGPFWMLEHILLLTSMFLLARWVFGYLLKRFETQIFMFLTSSILCVFLIMTISFTSIIFYSIQKDTLVQLQTNARVLKYSIDAKTEEIKADGEVIAQNPDIINMVNDGKRRELAQFLKSFLHSKKYDSLIVASKSGQVLARGENIERYGDSLQSNPLVTLSQKGEKSSSLLTKNGLISPIITIETSLPIKKDNSVIGIVLISTPLDNAFLDGISKTTGLNSSVYGGERISATTFINSFSKSRQIGLKETNSHLIDEVLKKGNEWQGEKLIGSEPYFTAFLPIKNMNNIPVGMLMVGKPESSVLKTAQETIEWTFIITIILLVLSIIPSYVISKYIVNQLK